MDAGSWHPHSETFIIPERCYWETVLEAANVTPSSKKGPGSKGLHRGAGHKRPNAAFCVCCCL